MPEESSTHREYVGDGYSVRVQHCERVVVGPTETHVCNAYLGVNYPSNYCSEHS